MGSVGDKIKKQEYIEKANQAEKKYGLPTNLLVGLIHAESRFNPNAVSPAGAIGIAQFMPGTAKDFKIDPRNVDQSIDAAGRYLSQNYKKLGNWDDTLRSYNMGLGNVYKWKQGKMRLPKETAEYVGKVRAGMGTSSYDESYSEGYKAYDGGKEYRGNIYTPYTPPSMIPTNDGVGIALAEGEEDTPEEAQAKEKIDKVTAEQQIIQEFFAQNTAAQPQQQQEVQQEVQESPTIGEQYAQVSQLVDTPIVEEGGFIKDSRGQWAHPGQKTEIPSPHITMQGINYPVLGISKETGEQKMMMPNQEYYFRGTNNVLEIPQVRNYFNKR